MSASSFSHLSNEELRQELNKNGIAYGPILANTRIVYEKKLQNMLEGKVDDKVQQKGVEENVVTNGNGTMNGDDNARTPSREASPLVESPQQQNRETSPLNTEERVRQKTPQDTNNEEDSDDEEDASENARVLTPEEIHSFHSGLMCRYYESPSTNLRQRREKSKLVKPMNGINSGIATNSTKSSSNKLERYVLPILVIFILVGMIVSAFYFRDSFPVLMKALPDVLFNRQPQQKKLPPTTTM